MQNDVVEATVRTTEGFLAKDGPTRLSFPARLSPLPRPPRATGSRG